MSSLPRTQPFLSSWKNGKPIKSSSVVQEKKILIWGPGRSGTTALAKIISGFGYTLDRGANASEVLESKFLNECLKSGDIDFALDYLMGLSDNNEKLVVKAPLLRAHPMLLERLSRNFAHIVSFRNPLAIAFRNYDYSSDFAKYFKSSIDETIRSEWTCRRLSAKGASVLSANYDILRAYPTECLVEAARTLGVCEPTGEILERQEKELASSFAIYNKKHVIT